jgi:hypothetical protein
MPCIIFLSLPMTNDDEVHHLMVILFEFSIMTSSLAAEYNNYGTSIPYRVDLDQYFVTLMM